MAMRTIKLNHGRVFCLALLLAYQGALSERLTNSLVQDIDSQLPFVSVAAGGFAVGCAIGGTVTAVKDGLKTSTCARNQRVKSLAELRNQMMEMSFTLVDWTNRNHASLDPNERYEFAKQQMMFDNSMHCVDSAVARFAADLEVPDEEQDWKLPWQCYKVEGIPHAAAELHQLLTTLYVLPMYWQVLDTELFKTWARNTTTQGDEACFLRYMQQTVADSLHEQKEATLKFLATLLKACNEDSDKCKSLAQEFELRGQTVAEVTEATVSKFKGKLQAPVYRACKEDPSKCEGLAQECGEDPADFVSEAESMSDAELEEMEHGREHLPGDRLKQREDICTMVDLTANQFEEWREKHPTALVDEDEVLTGVARKVAHLPTWRPNFALMGAHAVKRVLISLAKDWVLKAGIRGLGMATFAGNAAAAAAGEGLFVSLGLGAYGNLFGGIGAAVCSFAYSKVSGHTGNEKDSFGDAAANFKKMCNTEYNCCCKVGPCGPTPHKGEDGEFAHESEEGGQIMCCMRRKWSCGNQLGHQYWKGYTRTAATDQPCGTMDFPDDEDD